LHLLSLQQPSVHGRLDRLLKGAVVGGRNFKPREKVRVERVEKWHIFGDELGQLDKKSQKSVP
jgi:hypothetical protein